MVGVMGKAIAQHHGSRLQMKAACNAWLGATTHIHTHTHTHTHTHIHRHMHHTQTHTLPHLVLRNKMVLKMQLL